jgi:hypothetical protein
MRFANSQLNKKPAASRKARRAAIAATAAMARIAQRLHVPPEIIESMVSTPASQMSLLGRSI